MALNDLNKNAIAFKKLVGKAHTNQTFAYNEESVASNIQLSYSTVFAQPIVSEPATASGLTNLYDTNGIVELLKFQVSIIPDTQIGTNQSQGYEIKLPSDYSTFGALKAIYSGGTVLSSSLGKLQIVPPLYGKVQLDGSTQYDSILQDGSDNVISKFDPIDWIIDSYSGILFVQSPPAGYDVSPSRPAFVTAFLYVGQYLDTALTSGVTAIVNVDNITIGQSGITQTLYVIEDSIDQARLKISTGLNSLGAPIQSDGLGGFKFGDIVTGMTGFTASSGLTYVTGSTIQNPIVAVDIDSSLKFTGNQFGIGDNVIGKLQLFTGSTINGINANLIPIFTGSTYGDEPSVGLAIESLDNRIITLENTTFNGVTGATNLSGGTGIFQSYSANQLHFKSLKGGLGVNVSANTNTVTISATGATIPVLPNGRVVFASGGTYISDGDFVWEPDVNRLNVGNFSSSSNGTIVVGGSGTGIGNITGGGGALNVIGGDLTLESNPTHFVRIRTNGVERVRYLNNGAWQLASGTGTVGQFLTSNGTGSTPTWSTFAYNASNGITLTGTTFQLGGALTKALTHITLQAGSNKRFRITDLSGNNGITIASAPSTGTSYYTSISGKTSGAETISLILDPNAVVSSGGLVMLDGRGSPKGIQYSASGYVTTPLSLTTKEYVDILISGITATTQQNIYYSKKIVSGSTTLLDTDFVIFCDTTVGAFTITLPPFPIDGQVYKIKDIGNAGVNNVTVDGNSRNIDGDSTLIINSQRGGVEIVYEQILDEWFVMNFVG